MYPDERRRLTKAVSQLSAEGPGRLRVPRSDGVGMLAAGCPFTLSVAVPRAC